MSILKFPMDLKLKNMIKNLLAENPEHAWYQINIELALAKAGDDPEKRAEVLRSMAAELSERLNTTLQQLANETAELTKIVNTINKETSK